MKILRKHNLAAEEIIPDPPAASDMVVAINMRKARHMLDQLLGRFGRRGKVDRDCLYQILHLDLDQVRKPLMGATGAVDSVCRMNSTGDYADVPVFATMQMMLQAYMREKMLMAA